MEVHFTPQLEAMLEQAAANRGRNPEQLVSEIVEGFLAEEERDLRELQTAIDEVDVDMRAGNYTDYTEHTLHGFFEGIKQRASSDISERKSNR